VVLKEGGVLEEGERAAQEEEERSLLTKETRGQEEGVLLQLKEHMYWGRHIS